MQTPSLGRNSENLDFHTITSPAQNERNSVSVIIPKIKNNITEFLMCKKD